MSDESRPVVFVARTRDLLKLAARLERIKVLIDRRILDLFERSLGESALPPPESLILDRAHAERAEAL